MEDYLNVVLHYPTIIDTNFKTSNVNLIIGSYFCNSNNMETTFSGQIKVMMI